MPEGASLSPEVYREVADAYARAGRQDLANLYRFIAAQRRRQLASQRNPNLRHGRTG